MINKMTAALALVLTFSTGIALASDDMRTYQVTITNASTAHVLTPAAVIAHKGRFQLFKPGMAASTELATQAETGNPAPLLASAGDNPYVMATAAGDGLIFPGQSQTVTIKVNSKHPRFTVTSMLASTNDAFIAVKGVRMSGMHRSTNALVYDAGSEYNSESCHFIPGPPCGNPEQMRDTENAEGFVTFHTGIKGIADLDANTYDWRGPIAVVSIKKM